MIALLLALVCQPAFDATLERTSDGWRIRGRLDVPDGTALRVTRLRRSEMLLYNKRECRFETLDEAFGGSTVEAKGGAFEAACGNRCDVIRVEWGRDGRAEREVGDPRDVVAAMWNERAAMKETLAELKAIAVAARKWVTDGKPDPAELDKRAEALEKRIVQALFVRRAATRVMLDTLAKVRAMWKPPENPDPAPPEIPEGVNDEWSLELIQAFVARSERAAAREPLLAPLRAARNAWEEAVRAGKRTERWIAALAAVRATVALLEPEQGDACRKLGALAETLDAAIGGNVAGARKELEALDAELRKIPSR